jgi:hypothetical protein
MDVDFSSAPCGKTRIKYGENALHEKTLGIRYAAVEHSYCSRFKEDYEWQLV